MTNKILYDSGWFKFVAVALVVCLTALPLVPAVSMATGAEIVATPSLEDQKPAEGETSTVETPAAKAAEAEIPAAKVPEAETPAAEVPEAETPAAETPVVLHDHKKIEVSEHTPDVNVKEGTTETIPVAKEQETPQTAATEGKETVTVEPAESEKKGMSTMAKVGIGVGAVAVVGVALALVSSSNDDNGPTYPTSEELLGKWNTKATSHVDSRTYSGVYNFYAVGSHTYDIYVTGDEVRKQGTGTWSIAAGTNTLKISNDTGSVYVGDFVNEDFTTISMETTNGRWGCVLTKQ